MKILNLTRSQSLAVRKLLIYMGYNVCPYINSNLVISNDNDYYEVYGTRLSGGNVYTISKFLKDLNERKKV